MDPCETKLACSLYGMVKFLTYVICILIHSSFRSYIVKISMLIFERPYDDFMILSYDKV